MSSSSDILRIRLAQRLYCERNQIINSGACGGGTGGTGTTGPTGPEGPTGPTGSPGTAGNPKSFTFYLDWSNSNSLSRIYVPPGFSTLVPEGIYTANQVPNLIFKGTSQISINGTTYAFPTDMSCTGYSDSDYWFPTPQGILGGANITWQNVQDNQILLKNITAQLINGGNVGATRPESGVLEGWLGTLTIYYL